MTYKSHSYYIFLFVALSHVTVAQCNKRDFEEIESLQNTEKRNVVIFIHTDWCKYCQTMENTTFKNDSITTLLNNHFYFVDFNAESKNDIHFNGNIFKYKSTGVGTGIHELAEQLASVDGKISYPSICVLNDRNEILFQSNGLLNTKQFKSLLMKLK